MPRVRLVCLLVTFIALMTPAVGRAANQGDKVIQACEHGKPLTGFSQKAYAQALAELNGSAAEYSDCAGLIRQASLTAASGGSGGSGSGPGGAAGGGAGGSGPGSGGTGATTPLSAAERQALAAGGLLGGKIVRPQVLQANLAADLNALPTPLVLLLAALAAGALLVLASALHSRGRLRNLVPRGPLRNLVRARGAH